MRERLEHAPELLDRPQHDPAELEQSLDQVAEVNALLGGRRAVRRTLERIMRAVDVRTILDVGTGSADIPVALDHWARATGRTVVITASDSHPQMRDIATRRTAHTPRIEVAAADALALPFASGTFDVVLLSLTLHHFERAEQVTALREAARVARHAVVVNELERCRPNYWGARLLAVTRWRGNRLTRHDGPLSVLRAFTRAELAHIAHHAGLRITTLERFYFYRLVLVLEAES